MMKTSLLLLLLSLIISPASALQVTATGTAIVGRDMQQARDEAMRDALRLAALQVGGSVDATQMLSDGLITADQVRVNTAAQFDEVNVVSENLRDGVLEITITAQVLAEGTCPGNAANGYRKAVAIAGFPMQNPKDATLGALGDIEQGLPGLLATTLNGQQRLHALDAGHVLLFSSVDRAPASQNNLQRLSTSMELAKELGAQYVVSGVVRDMGMINPDADVPRFFDNSLRKIGLGREQRERNFALDVYVHDGVSGALVFHNTYATQGVWDIDGHAKTGFASAVFWKTAYGQQMKVLLREVVQDLTANLACQPYMAKIIDSQGDYIRLDTGGSVGMRPGDKLNVFRTSTRYNLDNEPLTELHDTQVIATITQVQPRFAIARLNKSAERFAIQREDVVVAW
ncbi:MAG: flagellar assembly protein T N-terminal domain-containing protein [Oceanospirillaceae bacterium]|nr:flagellar assembly protein T N-terminal domain-containing protein [Oceanospirillaceae bacterium]MCP5335797.1 flagellar assembly protein T N-terminal domain-containing protein [Oceanospirillaceae bacterium]MCP5349900.1 flagellar assembly protein T N-terminal domain-containing protein [Oceanospirillaceae bacterium]